MDRIAAMGAFVAVAEARGFSRAARKLGLSTSAVTRLLAGLEEHLGLQLLLRTTRSVALSDAGTRFLERARRILADVAEAEATARAERAEPNGRLVVTAPLVFGREHVAPLMCDLLARHPAVTAELTLSDRFVHLIDEGVDIAVRIGRLEDSSLRVRQVGATRRVLVASPQYLRARKRPRKPAELAGHTTIQVTPITPTPEWRLQQRERELRVPIAPCFVTNNVDAAIGHAVRGGGIVMLLAYQIVEQLRTGRLALVMPSYEPPPLPIQLAHAAAHAPSAAVRAFIDMAKDRSWRFVELAAEVGAKRIDRRE